MRNWKDLSHRVTHAVARMGDLPAQRHNERVEDDPAKVRAADRAKTVKALDEYDRRRRGGRALGVNAIWTVEPVS
jgi:hypothetical protein